MIDEILHKVKIDKINEKKYHELKNKIVPEESHKHFEKMIGREKDHLKKDYLSRKTYSNGFYQLIALRQNKQHRV